MGTRSKTRGPSSSWWWLEGNNEGGLISPIYSLYIYTHIFLYNTPLLHRKSYASEVAESGESWPKA